MEDITQHYTILKDPTRRKIIETLASNEKIGFKELRESLGLGVGTVYYHLDMLSGFIMKDKQHKYHLNDRGRMLYKVLKEGSIPTTLEIAETFSRRLGKWLFLSPVFAKTVSPLRMLPISIAILFLGALGSAYASLDPALFFYFQNPSYSFTSIIALYFFIWIGLFLFVEIFCHLLFQRMGNDLQLFACIGLASFPIALFPYMHMLFSYLSLPAMAVQYVLVVLQIWSLLLVSAAICFGKGIRLDKGVLASLTAMYLNMAILFLQGRFT